MNHYTFYDASSIYMRIDKREARKLWGQAPIAMCPHKQRPGHPMASHICIDPNLIVEGFNSEYDFERRKYDFDNIVEEFTWYNCQWHETGSYPAFYIVTPRINVEGV